MREVVGWGDVAERIDRGVVGVVQSVWRDGVSHLCCSWSKEGGRGVHVFNTALTLTINLLLKLFNTPPIYSLAYCIYNTIQ